MIIVALVVGAFLILNYDGEKKMTNTTATTDYQETIEYKGHTYEYNENVVTMAFLGVDLSLIHISCARVKSSMISGQWLPKRPLSETLTVH